MHHTFQKLADFQNTTWTKEFNCLFSYEIEYNLQFDD